MKISYAKKIPQIVFRHKILYLTDTMPYIKPGINYAIVFQNILANKTAILLKI